MNNSKFPDAIIKYLENTKMKDLAGDAFLLLINVFTDQSIEKLSD